jgi:putative ABC transport system permease protein
MFRTFLKVTWRNIRRAKGYAALNIGGLAIGLAVCTLITLYVRSELRFDDYHQYGDRIFRLQRTYRNEDGSFQRGFCTMAPSFAPLLRAEFPEIERLARLFTFGSTVVQAGDRSFTEARLYFAEPEIFDILTIPLLAGNPQTALADKGNIVLSASMARKYFGDEDPLGKSLIVNERTAFQVVGVMADVPFNAHLHFDFLASYLTLKGLYGSGDKDYFYGTTNYSDNVTLAYARLAPGAKPAEMQAKVAALIDRRLPARTDDQGRLFKASDQAVITFRPVREIHLRSHANNEFEPGGDIKYVRLFTLIAAFILIIAGVNFTNLASARASRRAKEVGLRKVAGASPRTLAVQFLGESVFMTFAALVFAVGATTLVLPAFRASTGHPLNFGLLLTPAGVLASLGIFVLTGLAAGLYPAVYLASFQPNLILRGDLTKGRGRAALRRALVVFQFAISSALIFSVVVISRQMGYVRRADLGFERQNIILIPANSAMIGRWEGFRTALLQDRSILAATLSKRAPAGRLLDAPGFQAEVNGQKFQSSFFMPHNRVEHDFFKTYGMTFVAGRDFSTQVPTDAREAFVLNETAVRNLGFKKPEEAVGAPLQVFAPNRGGRIIGVVRDFNYESLHRPVVAIVTYIAPEQANTLSLRIAPGSLDKAVRHVQDVFSQFSPGVEVKYDFLTDRLAALYRNEERMMDLFKAFSLLAVFVSCLGLSGLAAYSAALRTKEIGVRKVLGASTATLFVLLSKEFTKWVVAANVIAWPLAFFAMRRWLGNFAYRVDVGPWPFVLSAALAFLIALLTVSYQSARAAVSDPVKALRYE